MRVRRPAVVVAALATVVGGCSDGGGSFEGADDAVDAVVVLLVAIVAVAVLMVVLAWVWATYGGKRSAHRDDESDGADGRHR